MTSSIIAFILTLTQLTVVIVSYFMRWMDVFNIGFYHLSPVMVVLGVLCKFGLFSGISSQLVWVGLAYCVIKYWFFVRAMVANDPNALKLAAAVGEVLLIGGSTYYIISDMY